MTNSFASPTPLTVLHTSDWHLGRRLYGRMRYEEFEAFLAWLTETIVTHQVDVLIVAGDIFDTMTPSNKAQALYYEFLGKVSAIKVDGKPCCQHIVIVAGNHDSPTFLDAPSGVLKFLNVHVIGTACEDVAEEVLTLTNQDNEPLCIITAVPYLRDKDVRGSLAGESGQDKDANVIKGIRTHYDGVATVAKVKQDALIKTHGRPIPIIATGHLFAAGSKTTEDDGVRDLYVGSLGKVSADMFDECFDYVALGHLHVPQRVGGSETIRYSGSPIPMGFGEARQQKQVLLVRFGDVQFDEAQFGEGQSSFEDGSNNTNLAATSQSDSQPAIPAQSHFVDDLFGFETEESTATEEPATETISPLTPKVLHVDSDKNMQVVSLPIPCFQKLAQISGDLDEIAAAINALVSHKTAESVWLEVIYTGDEIVSDLREHVQALSEGLPCEILKIKNTKTYDRVLNQEMANETLQDLDELEVFNRCLDINNIAESQRDELKRAYEQILYDIRHEDTRAE
ncbi:MAG: exonuclease SbcCD subunit D C-terminal domain-containing protein [Psychrobacter sp.]|nr:exonuclease SbcCD subunit D C-terminal domain-containing protein [Psychrobacter sp.]